MSHRRLTDSQHAGKNPSTVDQSSVIFYVHGGLPGEGSALESEAMKRLPYQTMSASLLCNCSDALHATCDSSPDSAIVSWVLLTLVVMFTARGGEAG